ncbi:MAG: hypothetical protein L6Q53_16095 [Candidatus Brocadia sinica]|uniref:hypothetical protein n=1 Tax=Candidatus Brocadia TaxID=380240 RepID=UPI0012FE87DE|nr:MULTISPECIES: hypothetical protein [Brocadia]MCK6469689.1 hypothetical protein [Candidatus Brocadia sinica]NOG41828.1 hypothetical protein [Planctomycetota bacterium]NUO05612.1 hypothetical protein [Candidatus Brocadia sinica]
MTIGKNRNTISNLEGVKYNGNITPSGLKNILLLICYNNNIPLGLENHCLKYVKALLRL